MVDRKPPPGTPEDGYDDSQRAEVHEYRGGGPTDGVILTDMRRDRGADLDDDDEFGALDDVAADVPDADSATGSDAD